LLLASLPRKRIEGVNRASGQLPAWRRSVPIANEDRLVVPDALATTIKSAKLGCPGGARSPGVDGIRPAGQVLAP
jgi:hypothetical protein